MALGPILSALLDRYGLGSLKEWASQAAIQGLSEAEFALQLYDRPELHIRYPWIKAREAAGLTPMTIEEGLNYEGFARQIAHSYGIVITQDMINEAIIGDQSVKELEDRIGLASTAAFMVPQEERDFLAQKYGVMHGDLTSYFLDPKRQKPIIQKQFAAAQIAGEAQRSTFGPLTAAQAERLVEGGLEPEQARAGFGRLVESAELFEATDITEEYIGTEDKLGALLGEQGVIGTIEKRAARRKAAFEAGGGFATGQTGVRGLGSAAR